MTVSSSTSFVSYAGNGSLTTFAYTFKTFQDSDLLVTLVNDASGAETTQTLITDYTVTGAGLAGGGNVTFTTAPASGTTVKIRRVLPVTQETDYVANDPFPAEAHEDALDKLTMLVQQEAANSDLAISFPEGDVGSGLNNIVPAAVDRADRLLAFDTEGNVETKSAADLFLNDVIGANYTKASHTGNGSITAFSTSSDPGSKNNIQVYIDGVYQNKDTFSISGSTLTFSEAPPLNSAIEFIVGNAVTSISGDASAITYNQGGTGAQDRTLKSKLQDTVSVKDFGAVGDGVADDTAAFNEAIAAASHVYVPLGTYKITTTVFLEDNKHLQLAAGATISATVGTALHLSGASSSVMGNGNNSIVKSTVASPLGIICVGHTSTSDTDGIEYNKVQNLRIQGADPWGAASALQTNYTVGLMLFNAQGFNATGYVYYNSFSDLFIQDVKEGIVLAGTVNANFFNTILFWRMGHNAFHIYSPYSTDTPGDRYGYDWDLSTLNSAAAENIISNFFIDSSFAAFVTEPGYTSRTFSDGQSYPTEGAALRITGHANFNQMTNILCEPGYGTAYQIDTDVQYTYIQGAFNVSPVGTDNGTGTTILNGSGSDFEQVLARNALLYATTIQDTGTEATPAIKDRFENGTGIYFPSAGTLGVTSTGSEKFRVDANGLTVGSKTSSSGYDFKVVGDWYSDGNAEMKSTYPVITDIYPLGQASKAWRDVYTLNAVTVTSDRNLKQDITDLSDAELRVAAACKLLLKKYKMKSAVAEKGDNARWHFGMIAQDVEAAFSAEGLDAGDYGVFIKEEWWEATETIPAVQARAATYDSRGYTETPAQEAREAEVVTKQYSTEAEAPAGAVKHTRLGLRYEELLAFIIGAM